MDLASVPSPTTAGSWKSKNAESSTRLELVAVKVRPSKGAAELFLKAKVVLTELAERISVRRLLDRTSG